MGLDGERDLLETFHTSHQVIQSVIDMVSKFEIVTASLILTSNAKLY